MSRVDLLDKSKVHQGTIEQWGTNGTRKDDDVVGLTIIGELGGRSIWTTQVRAQSGNEIETLNNRYTLGQRSTLRL